MRRVRLIASLIAFLVGLLWIGQGVGMVSGSAMTGQSFWAVVGIVVVTMAAWLAWTALRHPASKP